MKLFLLICFMSSALLGMELESEPLINADSKDFVAIDINTPIFKENFKDAVNKGDDSKIQEYLEPISKKFMPHTKLDPSVAAYFNKYFSLREQIQQNFTNEYLLGVEESKQPPIIKSLMKLTDMRLKKATISTLEVYKEEQLKEKAREKKALCCVGVTACLALSGFCAYAVTIIVSLNQV